MKYLEGRFIGHKNLSLYYQGWLPANEPKAVLLVVHGLAEHSGRYMNVVNHFVHRLDRLYDAIETGKIELNDLTPRIRELRDRRGKLQARKVEIESFLSDRRVELASPVIVAHYIGDLQNLLNESSLPERRAFVQSFVKEIKITRDEVLMTYAMPVPPTGISEEKIGVLSAVQYGGPYLTVPELLFEKKKLIPDLQRLLVLHTRPTT